MTTTPTQRRPIASRQSAWAQAMAAALVRARVPPNTISIASVLFAMVTAAAALAGSSTTGSSTAGWFVLAAVAIPLRLLANLFDGMVAVEGGTGSPSGEVYNELPDRISDSVVLVALGYVVGGPYAVALGWLAALLAVLTAYVRVLGVAAGTPADFGGPLAKQQRMVLVACGLVGAAIEAIVAAPERVLLLTLAVLVLGTLATVVRRTVRVVAILESR